MGLSNQAAKIGVDVTSPGIGAIDDHLGFHASAERVDPQVPPRGPSARGRPGESAWRRHLEVGRFPALCGAVTQEDEGQAWDQDDANKAKRLLCNLVRRLEHEEPGVSGSILEGLGTLMIYLY